MERIIVKRTSSNCSHSKPNQGSDTDKFNKVGLSFSYKTINEVFDQVEAAKLNIIDLGERVIETTATIMAEQLQHSAVQSLFKNATENFNVALIEPLYPGMMSFAGKFNCLLIMILTLDALSCIYHSVGNPAHPVLNPEHVLVLHRIRPLLPNVIQRGGGMHLSDPKPLPKDLRKLLDEATNGFIYFSLGGNIKSNHLPEHVIKVYTETFAELPYTVLWKYEEDLPEKPNNLIISKWFPQQDILRHPNIKLFITQGGLQSLEEAIYSYVPIMGMPFALDQQENFSIWLRFLFGITPTFGARILGIIPTPSYSHQIVYRPLWRELSLRGHQVTVLTPNPIKDPTLTNLTEIDLSFSYKTINEIFDQVEVAKLNIIDLGERVIETTATIMAEQLQHSAVQSLFKNATENFDVALIEPLYPGMMSFAGKFNCPLIMILTLDALSCIYHSVGNPAHPVLNPEHVLGFFGNLNFFQRVQSTFAWLGMKYYICPRIMKGQQGLVNKYVGTKYPTIEEISARSSLMFVNTNIVLHRIRPLLPNVIQLGGGMHLSDPKPLPKDLANLLDKATNGFIYFSLGGNVKSNLLPDYTRKILLETFAELPYSVLWKYEQEDLLDKPDNVITSKWFPQQNILRHPNIKLFITQGGLQSIEEAVYSHVPIIGIPFAVDQEGNVLNMVDKGIGVFLDYKTLEKDVFKKTITEVINNPLYRTKAIELAELAKDVPMSGLESAVWWTEYVIRHKGAKHLRSPALDLPAYQYFLLDVFVFCGLVVLTIGYVVIKLFRLICNLCKKSVGSNKLKTQ
ncbi:hypothetical protein ILUMI_02413 [Ignelater luminosus]|uniref:UDP-glycosyltransferase n=1 Tax=Ignelater luminosus TaxID=2038154 RepID=A0A8K0GN70_IGNLU|nr:hypothetical protein ILUMI_02413 [Ignelater luminosus]